MRIQRYQRFDDFWPYYVSEHANPLNRKLHFWGTNNLFFWLVLAIVGRSPKLVVFAVISSYAYAWIGHFLIEKNRPATLNYPFLSALGDLQMYVKTWQGQMDAEVARYAVNDYPNAILTASATREGFSQ
jgi:hypothetical protein